MASTGESAEREICFPPYRLDLENERLERDGREISLRPKTLAVLSHLAVRAGKLVRKHELLEAIWPETYVTDTVVKVCVREIREALGDDPRNPRYLETASRRGYRFIATLEPEEEPRGAELDESYFRLPGAGPGVAMVGRHGELARLEGRLAKARQGERQLVFVVGEPGIGKTTLVDAFFRGLDRSGGLRTASGQCLEFFGSGEAYMPVLEMLNRLCQRPGGGQVVETLRGRAPSWLVQMPWLVDEAERDELHRRSSGPGTAQMLREMIEVLEALSAEAPLVIVLEDLHWSDGSTLDLISALVRRPERARLMILGTFRSSELDENHPLGVLVRDLRLHALCEQLELELLTLAEVEQYLGAVLGRKLPGVAELIEHRTEGHPLFVVHLANHLARLLEADREQSLTQVLESGEFVVPNNLRQLIEALIRRLSSEEQRLLEAASVVGVSFSTASLAGALGVGIEEVESIAEELARRGQIIRSVGTVQWPDATLAGRYEFLHTLYRSVLYMGLSEPVRVRHHQQIGRRVEQAFGPSTREIAGELAMHFERGQLFERAVTYREQAAQTAIRRHAYRETIGHLTGALELVADLPADSPAPRRELALRTALGPALMATRGYGAPEVLENYSRAQDLCSRLEETEELPPVMWGRWMYHWIRAEHPTALEIGRRFLALAEQTDEAALRMLAHRILGATLFQTGEIGPALAHLEKSLAHFDPDLFDERFLSFTSDSAVFCECFRAHVFWLQGLDDPARTACRAAYERSRTIGHPFSYALACGFTGTVHLLSGEHELARERIRQSREVSEAHGFPMLQAAAELREGYLLVEDRQVDRGFRLMERGIEGWESTGAQLWRPLNRLLLAQAALRADRPEAGLATLGEALEIVGRTGEKWCQPELLRLRAELRLASDGDDEGAEPDLMASLETARALGTVAWQQRTTSSLARLRQRRGRRTESRTLLEESGGDRSSGG